MKRKTIFTLILAFTGLNSMAQLSTIGHVLKTGTVRDAMRAVTQSPMLNYVEFRWDLKYRNATFHPKAIELLKKTGECRAAGDSCYSFRVTYRFKRGRDQFFEQKTFIANTILRKVRTGRNQTGHKVVVDTFVKE